MKSARPGLIACRCSGRETAGAILPSAYLVTTDARINSRGKNERMRWRKRRAPWQDHERRFASASTTGLTIYPSHLFSSPSIFSGISYSGTGGLRQTSGGSTRRLFYDTLHVAPHPDREFSLVLHPPPCPRSEPRWPFRKASRVWRGNWPKSALIVDSDATTSSELLTKAEETPAHDRINDPRQLAAASSCRSPPPAPADCEAAWSNLLMQRQSTRVPACRVCGYVFHFDQGTTLHLFAWPESSFCCHGLDRYRGRKLSELARHGGRIPAFLSLQDVRGRWLQPTRPARPPRRMSHVLDARPFSFNSLDHLAFSNRVGQ